MNSIGCMLIHRKYHTARKKIYHNYGLIDDTTSRPSYIPPVYSFKLYSRYFSVSFLFMADISSAELAEKQKARAFRKFTYRGVELEKLLDMPTTDVVKMFNARQRRKFARGIKREPMTLIKKLTKAKKECPYGEKSVAVKTHMRNMIILPEMIGSIVGVYNGKQFINVEIKPDLVGFYLGEFSITYKPVKHGRAGALMAGAKMVPLK